MEFRPVHLCIIQPLGYVHSLGFLDQARYLRFQFRRFGAEVTLAKNRLKHDAVNVVLGAHLGFDPELRKRYACIFLNLEQMGEGGAQVTVYATVASEIDVHAMAYKVAAEIDRWRRR